MRELSVKTKFDIKDSVFGFVDNGLHNLIIDRIETHVAEFGSKENKYTQLDVYYLATTTDSKFKGQHRFKEGELFTEEEIKAYVDEYFKNRKNS